MKTKMGDERVHGAIVRRLETTHRGRACRILDQWTSSMDLRQDRQRYDISDTKGREHSAVSGVVEKTNRRLCYDVDFGLTLYNNPSPYIVQSHRHHHLLLLQAEIQCLPYSSLHRTPSFGNIFQRCSRDEYVSFACVPSTVSTSRHHLPPIAANATWKVSNY